jgi:hypothetical protein
VYVKLINLGLGKKILGNLETKEGMEIWNGRLLETVSCLAPKLAQASFSHLLFLMELMSKLDKRSMR